MPTKEMSGYSYPNSNLRQYDMAYNDDDHHKCPLLLLSPDTLSESYQSSGDSFCIPALSKDDTEFMLGLAG